MNVLVGGGGVTLPPRRFSREMSCLVDLQHHPKEGNAVVCDVRSSELLEVSNGGDVKEASLVHGLLSGRRANIIMFK